jgi:hypothetical protein
MLDVLSLFVALSVLGVAFLAVAALLKVFFAVLILPLKAGFSLLKFVVGAVLLVVLLSIALPVLATVLPVIFVLLLVPALVLGSLCCLGILSW